MTVEFKSGDPHNFNHRVRLSEIAGSLRVYKPRCVFWEHFFLDSRSRFRQFLMHLSKNGCPDLSDLLGNVPIESDDQFITGSAAFCASNPPTINRGWYENFGKLVGFCTVFGITDLHKDNVLLGGECFQIVDVECLFWNIELPSETFLLPKSNLELVRGVLSASDLEGLNSADPKKVLWILAGLEKVMSFFKLNAVSLIEFFNTEQKNIEKYPIRILLRATQEYRLALDAFSFASEEYLSEEREQLARGDIPYFFGYLNKAEVHYYETLEKVAKVGVLNPLSLEKVKRAFVDPAKLLSSERLEKMHKQAIIEISRRLLDLSMLPYDSEGTKMYTAEGFLRLKAAGYSLQTKI